MLGAETADQEARTAIAFWHTIDAAKEERERIATRSYLARYLRLSLAEISGLTRSEIDQYVRAVSDMLARENPAEQVGGG